VDAAPATEILVRWLEDQCEEYKYFAFERLKVIGAGAKDSVPNLVTLFSSDVPDTSRYSIAILENMGPAAKAAVPSLLKRFLEHESEDALNAIAAIDPKDPIVRDAVLDRLERDPKKLLFESEHFMSWCIRNYLILQGPDAKRAIPCLEQLIDPQDNLDSMYVCETLGKIGEISTPTLLGLLKNKSSVIRISALKGFAVMGDPAKKLIPDLLLVLEDRDPMVRIEAARALWIIDQNEKAMTFFVDSLQADYRIAKTQKLPERKSGLIVEDDEWDQEGKAAAKRASVIMKYVAEIGPGAKPTLPALKRWADLRNYSSMWWLSENLRKAIKTIDGEQIDK